MRITVFTPTFNRAYIIEKLYNSLCRQTFKDFEWIVINDGSSDNTDELFDSFLEKSPFTIIYKKVENGGKHRAINKGVQLANGELFFIVDSDDYLTDNALERIDFVENSIPYEEKKRFAGICGNRGYSLEIPIGTIQKTKDYLDITALECGKYGISGDKSEVFYTEILKKYPFPEFEGENFLTESVVWDRIAKDGLKLRYFNEIIYIGDYLFDGLTKNYTTHYRKNPRGYGLYISQSIEYGKIKGKKKRQQLFNYFNSLKDRCTEKTIAGYLNMSVFKLRMEIFWLRFYYRFIKR